MLCFAVAMLEINLIYHVVAMLVDAMMLVGLICSCCDSCIVFMLVMPCCYEDIMLNSCLTGNCHAVVCLEYFWIIVSLQVHSMY